MNRIEYIERPFAVKTVSEAGAFDGYASVYNNTDLGGDIIREGAFKEKELNEDGKITVLWQHGKRDPIGVAKLTEDKNGLAFDGELVLDDPLARKARAHMLKKSVRGVSIGYDILQDGYKILEDGRRELTALKLWEISLVTFPMNPLARVIGAKSVERCRSVRELEDLLRDAAGLSRAQAKLHAGAIWKTVAGQRDADVDEVEVSEAVQQAVDRIIAVGQS